MTLDDMKTEAISRIEDEFTEGENFKVKKIYEGLMDGTLITIEFNKKGSTSEELSHVHFCNDEARTYRWHSDVLTAVSNYKERNVFFRLLSFAGVGGVIALSLTIIFAILLCILAFKETPANPSVIEVVKMSFTIILGFFFGSQVGSKK